MRSRHLLSGFFGFVFSLGLSISDTSLHFGLPEARAEYGSGEKDSKNKAPPEALRRNVYKVLKEAQALLNDKKYAEVFETLKATEAIENKTPFEIYNIEQIRGIAAYSAGDMDTAAKSFEAAIDTGKMPPDGQISFMEALSGIYLGKKDYAKSAAWGERYLKSGGTSDDARTRLVYAQYMAGDCATVTESLNAEFVANEQAGQKPNEKRLNIYANCYLKLNDMAGYAKALERYVVYYPEPRYWADLITRTQKAAGSNMRYALDFYRLMRITGNVNEAAEYTEMARRALEIYPAEAKSIIEEGYARNILGTGANAAEQKKLRDQIAKAAAEDQILLNKSGGEAKDPDAQVSNGYAFVTMGQTDKGIALMEQAIAKGGLKRADEAALHLGITYLQAGKKEKALNILKTVGGKDGPAQLARLWILYAQKP